MMQLFFAAGGGHPTLVHKVVGFVMFVLWIFGVVAIIVGFWRGFRRTR
jgi:hypothetical protein